MVKSHDKTDVTTRLYDFVPYSNGRGPHREKVLFRPKCPSVFLHRHRGQKRLRRRDWQLEKLESIKRKKMES